MPYDRAWDERPARDKRPMLTCSDCGAVKDNDIALIGTTGKLLCGECRIVRGFRYMFDKRDWREIAAEILSGAA